VFFVIFYAVMERNGDIASLFQKHEAKKKAAAAAVISNHSNLNYSYIIILMT